MRGRHAEARPADETARRIWRSAPIFASARCGAPQKPASARGMGCTVRPREGYGLHRLPCAGTDQPDSVAVPVRGIGCTAAAFSFALSTFEVAVPVRGIGYTAPRLLVPYKADGSRCPREGYRLHR